MNVFVFAGGRRKCNGYPDLCYRSSGDESDSRTSSGNNLYWVIDNTWKGENFLVSPVKHSDT